MNVTELFDEQRQLIIEIPYQGKNDQSISLSKIENAYKYQFKQALSIRSMQRIYEEYC